MKRLVIFDLDGTLLNTLADLATAANAALHACGFERRSSQEVQRFVGNGVEKLLLRALPENQKTPENLARMKHAFFTYYDAHLWEFTRPYPGIVALLEKLQAQDVKLAVASNKYQRATERLVAHFFPTCSFSAVLGQREGVPTKPHPHMVQEILTQAHVSPAEAWYVGDSEVDMQTAAHAGVQACGVLWGFRTEEDLLAFRPACLVRTVAELEHQLITL